DECFDRRGLQPVVFLFMVRQLREPFPPIHPGEKRMACAEFERRLDATVLDFRAMLAARLEPPRLRRRARAFIVADLREEKFLPTVFLRKFLQLRALALPPGRDFGCAWVRA